jgi:hypothetical protein
MYDGLVCQFRAIGWNQNMSIHAALPIYPLIHSTAHVSVSHHLVRMDRRREGSDCLLVRTILGLPRFRGEVRSWDQGI